MSSASSAGLQWACMSIMAAVSSFGHSGDGVWPSSLVNVLGEPLAPGFSEIDVAGGIDPEPVARARRVEAGQHLAAPIHDADRRPLLADVRHLLLVEIDVGRLHDVAPL